MATAQTYAALLRGINVGGRRPIPMGELRTCVERLGHEDVRSYIQSGNLVFRTATARTTIVSGIERAVSESFGVDVSVILRSAPELRKIVARNPFADGDGADGKKTHVLFLAAKPPAAAVQALDPERSPGDTFSVAGNEIYLLLPNGSGRTKLTLGYFEGKLGVAGTARNWNTLLKLVELTG